MKEKIWIIIPALNEEKTIGKIIREIHNVCKNRFPCYEIIVLNDGSTDMTKSEAIKAGATALEHPVNFGKGKSITDSWFWIMNRQRLNLSDIIIHFDADGQHNPSFIPKFVEELNKYNMVIGKRDLRNYPFYKKFGNKSLSWLASIFSGQDIKDSECGFRCFRVDTMIDLYKYINAIGYEIEIEINIVAGLLGCRIAFIEIPSVYRKGIGLLSGIKNGYYAVKIWLKMRLGWLKWK